MMIVAAIVLAVVILAIITTMLLRRQLREKYAVLWLVIGLLVLILGVFPGFLSWLALVVGVALPSNLLFILALLLLLGVTLHLSWELSKSEDEARRLAEEVALLRTDIDELRQQMRAIAAENRGGDGEAALRDSGTSDSSEAGTDPPTANISTVEETAAQKSITYTRNADRPPE